MKSEALRSLIYWRGKHFTSNVPTGTIDQVCVYMSGAGGSVDIKIKPSADNAAPTYQTTISAPSGASGWKCQAVNWWWDAATLFMYRTGGTAMIGADQGLPYDSKWSSDNGQTWQGETYRRGYKLHFA